MRALPRRAVLAAPAAVLMFALVACGGSDSGSDSSGAADTQQSAQSAGGAEAAGEAGGDTDDKKEPPLTGDIKQKAEAAALAAYPGTVVKSEEDAEKPGMYAVEVKQADGTSIEVYIDKSFQVTDTKKEGTEETEDAG
ncbi:PepSY domain-containing protein [Streptomyces cellostaticus]|uniref:PepSY domain-containing protein n=1 Tax=Streptomyces cellostaticus TaxID=67285 RepID=UPI002025BB1D|nr:PepSY domain-containing protein [Streptomyces cellostaticus]